MSRSTRLAPAVSALARKTIKVAFDELGQTISPADSRDFHSATLQIVKNEALEIERQLAARGSLRNMRRLMPLFKGLEHYSKVMDVLCNGTPYLSWIWAPISLILRIASEYVEAFEQIMKGYSRISESLRRIDILRAAFISDSEFQETLAVFYADILEFHKHAYKFVRRSGWKLLFFASWGRFQRRFDNVLEDMKRHESLIDLEANARNIADIRSWKEKSLEEIHIIEEEQSTRQYQSIVSFLKMDESDQLAIFESISAEGLKHPGTCGWLLQNSKIRAWLQRKPDMPMLWLQGTAGSGKSVISTQLVNYMQAGSMSVIHHFCSYSYSMSTLHEQILRSLLLQLLRKDGDLVAHVYQEFVVEKKAPKVPALEKLLQLLFKSMSCGTSQAEYIWIILDGLDECEMERQARVVSLMNQIASQSTSGGAVYKVLISSRTSPVLSHSLRKVQRVSLSDEKEHVETAIRQYASQRLHSFEQKFRQLHIGPNEMDDIQGEIAKRADGMFLYARLVLDYLATNIFYSGHEIKTSVNQLPKTLSDFYQKILIGILIQLDSRSISRIKCVFSWIAFAKRPLKKLELLSAVSFSSENPEIDLLVPEYILDICGPLIEERRDTTIGFMHVSVKEYLQSSSSNLIINGPEALIEHGRAAITCILSGLEVFNQTYPEHTQCVRVIRGLHGLHLYATEYWAEYILSYAASTNGGDLNSPLFIFACQLASKLDVEVNLATEEVSTSKEVESKSDVSDERLELLQQLPSLFNHVKTFLEARSLQRLETELLQVYAPAKTSRKLDQLSGLDGISEMLISYQGIIRSLLSRSYYPEISSEELEQFKAQFRTSAFTCRLNSCPRATLGFESESLCLEHEMAHLRQFPCTFPGCKYPPLVSAQSLKNHLNKHHNSNPPRKSIREVRRIPTIRSGNAVRLTGQPWNSSISRTSQDSGNESDQSIYIPPEDLFEYYIPPEGLFEYSSQWLLGNMNRQQQPQSNMPQQSVPQGTSSVQQAPTVQNLPPVAPQTAAGQFGPHNPMDQFSNQQPQHPKTPAKGPIRMPTMREIQNVRNHPSGKMAGATDDQIRQVLMKHQMNSQQHQQQQQRQQQLLQMLMEHNMALNAGQPPGLPQGQMQPNGFDQKDGPTSSPAQPANKLKRLSSDDVVEVPNPNTQQLAQQQAQRPNLPTKGPQGNHVLTPQQVQNLDPEARKRYEQALRAS
ncbi:hypothetical protein F5884DRAFT_904077 [Xylogone sp. PMI_703]|nr:hypothetical protein F5884DRAFT_904077 [Xylogone sp. PMI_703]